MRNINMFSSQISRKYASLLMLGVICLAMCGCAKDAPKSIQWNNAYDIERELHLLGQQEDPREIYRRLQGMKQQASLQLSQLRQTGRHDPLFIEWLESLRISLSLAPLYGNSIETCNVWQNAMEEAWGARISNFNERAKLVWRVMVATCNARVRSV